MKANLVNVTNLKPQNYEEHRWYLKVFLCFYYFKFIFLVKMLWMWGKL